MGVAQFNILYQILIVGKVDRITIIVLQFIDSDQLKINYSIILECAGSRDTHMPNHEEQQTN